MLGPSCAEVFVVVDKVVDLLIYHQIRRALKVPLILRKENCRKNPYEVILRVPLRFLKQINKYFFSLLLQYLKAIKLSLSIVYLNLLYQYVL
jgi:hypothetical protein